MRASAAEVRARELEDRISQANDLAEEGNGGPAAELKKRLYNEVGSFLTASFSGRHWWCTYPGLMTFMMRVLELYPTAESVRHFYAQMAQQLASCTKCVDIYHASLPGVRIDLEYEFTLDSIKVFFHQLAELDAERIHRLFALQPTGIPADDRVLAERISVTLYEVLSQRRLLSDFRVLRVFSKWVSTPLSSAFDTLSLELLRGCSGLYYLLVSPDPGVRTWATSAVKHTGRIDLTGDSGHDKFFMTVLDEWMYILESESFNKPVLSLGLSSTEGLDIYLDESNCAKTPTSQILWAALDTVMQQMDENSLETMLEAFDNLPDLVFNNLEEADPTTTKANYLIVICRCYKVLLQCLGHRFWNHTARSSQDVVTLIIEHCKLPSWHVSVKKHMIELFPPLLAAMRPPQASHEHLDQDELRIYFETRDKLIEFLIHPSHRPAAFGSSILFATATRAMMTIVSDCYELRQVRSSSEKATDNVPRDDGALPESSTVAYSVSESTYWWPCGVDATGSHAMESLWMNHLFEVVRTRSDNDALIDHAALTCSTILRKHLQLARDALYSCITNGDAKSGTIHNLTNGKPIVTILLEKLCALEMIALIPITVHGALFESIGGVAELLNCVAAQPSPSPEVCAFLPVLSSFETHTLSYFLHLYEDVFTKGLTNPLRFPVVAQHIGICLLSPTENVDKPMKQLLGHLAANKDAQPNKVSPPLQGYLISAHRNTEAFLRGVLSLLQTLRLYNFALPVSAPIVKKVVFSWHKVFELLGNDVQSVIEKEASKSSPDASMKRVPILISDFLIAVFSSLYNVKAEANSESTHTFVVDEGTRVRCLEFAVSFWKFWSSRLAHDPQSLSKRASGIVAPLVTCINKTGAAAEKTRAAQLLMVVMEHFVAKRTTALDESTLQLIESAQNTMTAIDADWVAAMRRVVKKLRQLDKSLSFFGQRASEPKPLSLQPSRDRSNARVKSIASSMFDDFFTGASTSSSATRASASASSLMPSTRPMSAKAAARAKARMAMVDLTGVTSVSNEAASRKSHSFYDEEAFAPPPVNDTRSDSQTGPSRSKTAFSVADVAKSMSKAHPGANRRARQSSADRPGPKLEDQEDEEDEEEEEPTLRYAALFHRIRSTQKPIPVCSLLPFYRQLLQLCMPALLTHEFECDQSSSKRELVAPALTFGKSSDYVNAFLPLLLEECNNDVQEGLLRSSRHGGGHLMRYESEKPREGMRCLSFSLVQVDEGTRSSMNTKFDSNRFRGPMNLTTDKLFRNGDVVLLRAVTNRPIGSAGRNNDGKRSSEAGFTGNREFVGVIMISEAEKGKRHTITPHSKKDAGAAAAREEDIARVLFLNDGELDTATSDRVASFDVEALSASALAETEWRVQPASNVVTSAREYIALRSVDLLPEHLRSTILTPNVHKSTQTDIIAMAEALDSLRVSGAALSDGVKKIIKLLKRLDKLDVTLTDLRATSIGKMVNKLRKHGDEQVRQRANALKDKWTALLDQSDLLERAPRFLAPELWQAVRSQYNQSQLQAIHSVLSNYGVGVSLLQGPPGTGKTKTIMALLSGFIALRPPASALMPSVSSSRSKLKAAGQDADATNAKAAAPPRPGSASTVSSGPAPTFSLGTMSSAAPSSGSILRRTDAPAASVKRTTIQSLKNASSVRSRLEHKMSSTASRPAAPSLVVRRRVVSNVLGRQQAHRSNHVLLCAPSNGAVNELVLRIVTDGLLDATGAPVKVRAPSVHAEASNCDWISIVRLGNPGIDAAEAVAAVSLPNIVKREMDIHPKNIELRSLQDSQKKLRASIRDFHQNVKEQSEAAAGDGGGGRRPNRKALAKMHAELTSVSGKVRRLRDEVFALKTKLTEAVLSRASIIACTLSKAGSGPFNSLKRGFDALIIDEAAQAVELSTLVPLRERVARVVLVGDPKQLPATVKSVVAARGRYDRSLFERIADSGVAPSMLRVQYRMHPFLREFPSKRFYNGMLTDGPSVMERVQRTCARVYASTCFQPFLLYDVSNSREEDVNGSKWNRGEAQFCVQLCETMFAQCADVRVHKWSVGFVSPYREQVNAIRRELSRSASALSATMSVEVNTVDGFQGREKDVIIFSCVRSSQRGGIGFLRDIRRLNVAITRARFCLFVIGDVRTLVRDETWHALVRSARERKLVIDTHGDPFPEVVTRLERSDHGKELAEHYREMHEKAARKANGSGASGSSVDGAEGREAAASGKRVAEAAAAATDDQGANVKEEVPSKRVKPSSSAVSQPDDVVGRLAGGDNADADPVVKHEPGAVAPASEELKREGSLSPTGSVSTASTATVTSPTNASPRPDTSTANSELKGGARKQSSTHPSDVNESQQQRPKRPADREDSADRHRKLARTDSLEPDRRDGVAPRSDQRPASTLSSASRDDRSDYRDRYQHDYRRGRDRSRSRGRDSRRPPSDRYGGGRSSNSNSNDEPHAWDRRSQSARHDSFRSGSHSRSGRDPGSGHAPAAVLTSAALPSISAKEFCMENEPAPPSAKPKSRSRDEPKDDRPSWLKHALGKRPLSATGAKPPLSTAARSSNPPVASQHGRPRYEGGSASRGGAGSANYRRVEYESSARRPSQTSEHKRPGGSSRGSADVLGSILGSTSKLASSTSRVQGKASRTSEF